MAKNAVVVGPPRSGTSLTASIFARKGFFVAEDESAELDNEDFNNPFGYWEVHGLIESNVELFKAAGYAYHNTWLYEDISDDQVRAIGTLDARAEHRQFVDRYQSRAPWMWKDPRLCYTLPYWWKLLDPDNTGVVLVRRDPEAVYASLRRMKLCDPGETARTSMLRRIENHAAHARSTVKALGIPHVTVEYHEYLETPAAVASRLGGLFDLDLTVDDLNIRPDLDHSTPRGKVSHAFLALARKFPRGPRKLLARLLPRKVMEAVLPERKYVEPRRPG